MLHLMDQGIIPLTWVIGSTFKGTDALSGTGRYDGEHLSVIQKLPLTRISD